MSQFSVSFLILLGLGWLYVNMLNTQGVLLIPRAVGVGNETRGVSPKTAMVSARQIVEQAYQSTFSALETCPSNETFQACIRTQQERLVETNITSNNSWPWWFHTMLRDSLPPNNGLFGSWHNLSIVSPRLDMCVIEKIGTKHWRQLQCKMNRPDQEKFTGTPCRANEAMENSTEKSSSTVFLRDPLERFLSGFLDKCVKSRTIEVHCEPLEVFRDSDSLVEGIINDKHHFFEAYVDTMPLKWNMHFFPQSFYCDGLFRHIHRYHFVGHMGHNFYHDVHRLGLRFREERFLKSLDDVFQLKRNLALATGNVGVETSAASHVKEYYTPATVRRVLEYTSIDYVLLNLPIPEWAQQMLNEG